MGIAGQMLRKEAHLLNDLLHLMDPVGLIPVKVEIIEALRDDLLHRGPLVQRRCGILEHHLDIADHLAVQRPGDLSRDPDALIADLAPGTGVGADDGASDGRFSRPRLAHKGKGLALVNIEGYVLDSPDNIVALAEIDVHMLEGEEDLLPVFGNRAMLRETGGAGIRNCVSFLFAHCTPSFYILNTSLSLP